MQDIDLHVRDELFEKIDVKTDQLCCYLNRNNDIQVNGSLIKLSQKGEGESISIKANLCDENGCILYVLRDFSNLKFDVLPYATFSIYCADISRFFDKKRLHYVELYPYVLCENEVTI